MATVSGSLIYDNARMNTATSPGIGSVPMVLQNTDTGTSLAVATDSSGKYTFTNVPPGNYQVVEQYGYTPVSATGDFATATSSAVITTGGTFPPISSATGAPASATNLDAVTSTTMKFAVASSDVTVGTIRNGPVKYTPFGSAIDSHIALDPTNLITGLGAGSFGTAPAGSPPNTAPSSQPYPEIASDFNYSGGSAPPDGSYTIVNSRTNPDPSYSWWPFSDHTNGNETGRYDFANGANPGSTLAAQTVAVDANSNYLLDMWILNAMKTSGSANPALSIQVTDASGKVLYDNPLGKVLNANTDEPEWVQVGDIFNTGTATSVTMRIVSQGPAATGNDFAIDDIVLQKATILPSMKPVKTPSSATAHEGDTITYSSNLTNTFDRTVTNAYFQDTMPDGLTFVPGSVKVNGVAVADDPTTSPGVKLPDVEAGKTVTVTFDAKVTKLPTPNPAVNVATSSFNYNYISDNAATGKNATGDGAPLTVKENADVTSEKHSDKISYAPGDPITYVININNAGPSAAKAPTVSDTLPAGVTSPEYSIDNGTSWAPWTGSVSLPDLASLSSAKVLIRGKLKSPATSADSIANSATITSATPDKNDSPVSVTAKTADSTGGDPAILDTADMTAEKASDKKTYSPGQTVTYTVKISNAGPATAKTPTVSDTLPVDLENQEYSTDNGANWAPWTGSATLADIPAGGSVSVLLRGTLSTTAAPTS